MAINLVFRLKKFRSRAKIYKTRVNAIAIFVLFSNFFKLINTLDKLYFSYYKLISLTKIDIYITFAFFIYFNYQY